jgi:hypothetical protein
VASSILWLPIFLVVLSVLLVWLLLRRRQRLLEERRTVLLRRVDQITAEFPDEVQSWGGKKALLNTELVREMIATLDADEGGTVVP